MCLQSNVFVTGTVFIPFRSVPSAWQPWFLIQDLGCYDNRNLDVIGRDNLVTYCQFCQEIIFVPDLLKGL